MERPGKIVCIGRNYAAHARELGNTVPERPLLFLKPPSAVIGDGDTILLPSDSRQVEHEAEIGVVMGRRLSGGDESAARAAIAGITCVNDVTARDLQKLDVQFTRAKGFDTFCPVGPRVHPVHPDFDYASLEVICRVNGAVRQAGVAAAMAFQIPVLVAFIANVMTLEPGDLVVTGTPEGVGPLRAGDVVEVEVTGVGILRNPVAQREG
jgi:2-keto-4-pentenoate hydratase/2-oxohepta-3-ene-1,7-dioic acid hydratase in catechol pathway